MRYLYVISDSQLPKGSGHVVVPVAASQRKVLRGRRLHTCELYSKSPMIARATRGNFNSEASQQEGPGANVIERF